MGLLDDGNQIQAPRGLLGDSMEDPRTMAVFAGIRSLLGGRGALQGVANGVGAYGDTMQQARQQASAEQMRKLQMQHELLGIQTGQMQLTQMQQQIARQNAIRDALAKAETGGQLATPGQAAPPQSMAFKPGFNAQGPTPAQPAAPAAPGAPQGGNLTDNLTQRLVQQAGIYARNGDFDNANKLYEQAAKFLPEVKEINVSMQNGQPVNVITYKNGKQEVSGFAPTPKVHWMDTGGKIQAVDENTQKPLGGAFGKTVSPDTMFGGQVTMRGQNMTDARARDLNAITREGQQTQVINDPNLGIMFANKGTGLVRPGLGMDGKPIPSDSAVAAGKLNGQLQEGINMARELIPKATNSGAGALLDKGAGFFGASTDGAIAATQLKTLSGWMTANVPRMQGPQSDKDVAMYRQMAAQVGDESVPREQRLAALGTLEQLQRKYATINQASPLSPHPAQAAQPVQGLKFLGFEGQ